MMPWMWVARNEIARNIVIAMTPIIASVVDALCACGRRNAGTPLEMASTPVSAVDPDENARRMYQRVTVPTPVASSGSGGTCAATGHPPMHW